MKSFWYEPSLKEKARYLRKNSTKTEIYLWSKLRKKQILGFDFDRQVPIDHFIVDFFCKELMLAIEIDGSSHDGKLEYDIFREEKLNKLGISILRFTNDDILDNMKYVINEIKKVISDATSAIS
jgi:very-short-patch-repair endonuclease